MPDLTTMLNGAGAVVLLGAFCAFFVIITNWYENRQFQRAKEWEKWKKELRDREKGPP